MVAAVEMTESRLAVVGEVGGGERGLDEADVATANATAAVEVLLLNAITHLNREPKIIKTIVALRNISD